MRSLRLLLATLAGLTALAGNARADIPANGPTPLIPPAPHLHTGGYALLDAGNGQLLAAQDARHALGPSASTKLMLAYVTFEEMTAHRIKPATRLPVSVAAWRTPGSSMFLKPDTRISVSQLLDGLITDGGNDAAVCLAQGIAGTRQAALSLMNQTAAALGLTHTHYTSVDGLNDRHARTTALDAARLGAAVVDRFPQYLPYFRHRAMRFDGIEQYSFDRLLIRDPSALGLTVGDGTHGYGIVAAARQDGTTLVASVLGTPGGHRSTERAFAHVAGQAYALLSWAFDNFDRHVLYRPGHAIRRVRVRDAAHAIPLGVRRPLVVLVPRGQYRALRIRLRLDRHLRAPVARGQDIGTLQVTLDGRSLAQTPAVALRAGAQENLLQRMTSRISHWL
ncbi:D-alanyl-D-alanine carboxypeptidase family protein [Acidihalobacter prosperus]|uniref:serine-type D-Ala-D-Ala carboxypeptidase n=1 Tax=Acidihalobacter prosperus TaxID=160660 RepID=A0A1A6C654_9GAMM|nr:D-alanyl-D-alanine carboxypeptidase family protein [Acidihalobacter prosperus]OBS10039.1 hypothetical protein Thpro_021089 [Acidihalobacter prosperus]